MSEAHCLRFGYLSYSKKPWTRPSKMSKVTSHFQLPSSFWFRTTGECSSLSFGSVRTAATDWTARTAAITTANLRSMFTYAVLEVFAT